MERDTPAQLHQQPLLELVGDCRGELGFETGAQLYRGSFAGWDVPHLITADQWMRPRRYLVHRDGAIPAAGYIEPTAAVSAGETFAVNVPAPAPAGVLGPAPTATLIVHSR